MILFWYARFGRSIHSLQSPSLTPCLRSSIPKPKCGMTPQNTNPQLTCRSCGIYRLYSSECAAAISRCLQAKPFSPFRRIGLKEHHQKITSVPARSYFDRSEVIKDVLLYRNEKLGFIRVLGAFACAQLMFWSYLTYSSFTSMRDAHVLHAVKYGPDGPPKELKNWRSWAGIEMYLSTSKWRHGITALCIVAGTAIFASAHMYSRRSISSLVLLKGGNRVRIETFGLFGLRSSFTMPVSNLSCHHSRQQVISQLPIKVKGHRFHYMLDKQGKFLNGRLFDHTAGMKRIFT